MIEEGRKRVGEECVTTCDGHNTDGYYGWDTWDGEGEGRKLGGDSVRQCVRAVRSHRKVSRTYLNFLMNLRYFLLLVFCGAVDVFLPFDDLPGGPFLHLMSKQFKELCSV